MKTLRVIGLLALTAAPAGCSSGNPTEPRLDPPEVTQPADAAFSFTASHEAVVVDPDGISCSGGAVPGMTELSGQGTYLGRFTGVSRTCSLFADQQTGTLLWAEIDLTGAGGDALKLVLDSDVGGHVSVTLDATGMPSTVRFDVSYLLAGGTGRFAGASGSASQVVEGSLTDGVLRALIEGTITTWGVTP